LTIGSLTVSLKPVGFCIFNDLPCGLCLASGVGIREANQSGSLAVEGQMASLIHFVFQTAAVLSLFVIMRRAQWEAQYDPEAPESGRDASDDSPADSFGSSRAETRDSGTRASHV
jgi:hypothetical protein